MPPIDEYEALLRGVWQRKWLTNAGQLHRDLEWRLSEYLNVEHISLFCNGTIALLVALQLLEVNGGEIITTPFTFPATVHALHWVQAAPVFCDIDPVTLNLNPKCIEASITTATKAILPVHVYGTPCDTEAIQEIADRYNLKVIYDAAHTFGVRCGRYSLLEAGDASILSFHATKLFSTLEGGAVVVKNKDHKQKLELLKNFGLLDPETIVEPGLNGKMNEMQAAYGLLHLSMIDSEIASRRELAKIYRERLRDIPGLDTVDEQPGVAHNYAYFPILVNSKKYGMTRDDLFLNLRKFNIMTRRYFYPLCSRYPIYAQLPSSDPQSLPVAEAVARQVLCLPIYGTLEKYIPERICLIAQKLHELTC